jgi:hypothetical protein
MGGFSTIGGAGGYNVVSKTSADSPYSASNRDYILADASGGAITVTVPSPSSNSYIGIKKTDSSANVVTVQQNAAETIDGQTSITLEGQNEYVELVSDGTNWYIISSTVIY